MRAERRQRERQPNLNAAIGAALAGREPIAAQLQQCTEAPTRYYDAVLARIWTLDDRWETMVDPAWMERVLSNLMGNAIKYSPDGGEVVLSVTCESDAESGALRVVLTVTDQGIGIPQADSPRLLEPFFRASNALDRVAGSGVGLAGSRQIVLQHGGELRATSLKGSGGTFTLVLPLDSPLHP